jgi:GTP-binding protein Era
MYVRKNEKMKTTKCGYVAIVGRPNVGKSTLLNASIGEKISIISPKPQTTRNQILGIKTLEETQIVYIDTPGLHKAEKRPMNRYLNRLASSVLLDADVILFMISGLRFDEDDSEVLLKLQTVTAPVILIINKVDLIKDKSQLLPFIEELKTKYTFNAIIPLSAKKNDQVKLLETTVAELLPTGPFLFPKDQLTDKDINFQVAELIREKLIQVMEEEIPYSTNVVVESIKTEKNILKIDALIWVEREGQKPIVIGKNGEQLKKIGTMARHDIEKRLGKKVFLRLWVKVKSDWTQDEGLLQGLNFKDSE